MGGCFATTCISRWYNKKLTTSEHVVLLKDVHRGSLKLHKDPQGADLAFRQNKYIVA